MYTKDIHRSLILSISNINMRSKQYIPVSFFTFFTVQDTFAVDRIERFVSSFREHPSMFIVVGEADGMLQKHKELSEWVQDSLSFNLN
jgi:hypothetical protein